MSNGARVANQRIYQRSVTRHLGNIEKQLGKIAELLKSERIKELESENDELRAEATRFANERDNLGNEIGKLICTLDSWRDIANQWRSRSYDMQTRATRLADENDELRAECTRLYGEHNELEPIES